MKRSVHFSRGLSLIELMIAMAIGLLLISAIGWAFLGSRGAYRQQEALARMQEGARFAFETMTHDIRMAGFTGCRNLTAVSTLSGTDWFNNLYAQPLVGYDAGAAPAVISASVVAGDALAVLRADNDKEYVVANHNAGGAQFQLTANHDFQQGEILVATDCNHSALFQMTNANPGNSTNLVNNAAGASAPGNCTTGLGESAPNSGLPSCTPTGVPYTFAAGSRLLRLSGNIYYIRNNPNGIPSLYRLRLGTAGGNASATAEELVEGVENMQITYGVDTSSPATCAQTDGTVDAYVDAADVPATVPCATAVEDWKKVLSVRIRLLMRSEDNIVSTPQSYFFDDPVNATTATDNRLRQVFTTTIAVRNRL